MNTPLLVNMVTGLALLVVLFDLATAGLCWLLWRRPPRPTEPAVAVNAGTARHETR